MKSIFFTPFLFLFFVFPISAETHEKKETPDGLWYQCPKCKHIITSEEHKQNLYCCLNCNHHERIGSNEYFSILFDKNKFVRI